MNPGTAVIVNLLGGIALLLWGVRMVRTHHLGFFGLRLSLLLLALLMMSVACVGLGDVGAAATRLCRRAELRPRSLHSRAGRRAAG